jgi:hypothetical protein
MIKQGSMRLAFASVAILRIELRVVRFLWFSFAYGF